MSESACARIAQAVVSQEGLEARPAVLVHDLSMMEGKFDALAEAFPEPALHAVAVKANPVVEILRRLVAAGRAGVRLHRGGGGGAPGGRRAVSRGL